MALPANNEYDLARKRAKQDETAALQGQKEALQRRAAQTGGGVSGALIKQESIANDQSQQRLQSANEGINASQRAEERRIAEVDDARKFSREERLGSQDFQAGQGRLGREFSTAERLGSQGFQSGESALGRRFATGEREAGQAYGTSERLGGQSFASRQAADARKYGTSERLAGQTFMSGEAGKQRTFTGSQAALARKYGTSEREAGQGFASRMQDAGFTQQEKLQAAQLGQQRSMFDVQNQTDINKFRETIGLSREEFEQSKYTDRVNEELARKTLEQKGPLESLFSGFKGMPGVNARFSGGGSYGGGGGGSNYGDTLSKFFGWG